MEQFSQLKNASVETISTPSLGPPADLQSHEASCLYPGLKWHSGLEITTVKSAQLFSMIQAEKMPVNNNNNGNSWGKWLRTFS